MLIQNVFLTVTVHNLYKKSHTLVIHSTVDNKTQTCDILLIMPLLSVNNNNNKIEYSEAKKVEAKAT